MKLTETTGPKLGGQKPKGRKNSTLNPQKRRPQAQCLKKKREREGERKEKAEKYCINEGTN